MAVLETERLILRELYAADAPFLHALLTDADFLAQIGDRGVASVDDARRAIAERYGPGYATHGFGMWVIEGKAEGVALGLAGLVRRDALDHVDIGYALLPAARGRGYALEAARGVYAWAAARGIAPVVAIVSPGNRPSQAILGALGLVPDRRLRLPGVDHDVILYVPAASAPD